MDSRGIRILAPPNSSACHTQLQWLLLPPPSVLPSSSTIPSAYPSFSPPQRSPSWPPQLTPLNPSSANLQVQVDCRVITEDHDRNFFVNGSSTAGDDEDTNAEGDYESSKPSTANASAERPHSASPVSPRGLGSASAPLNPSSMNIEAQGDCRVISEDHNRNFFANGSSTAGDDEDTNAEGDYKLSKPSTTNASTERPCSASPVSPRGLGSASAPLNPSSMNIEAQGDCRVTSEDHDRNFFVNGSSIPGDDEDTDADGDYESSKPSTTNASTKRRRSASPFSPRGLGSAENPINVEEIASLFEPIVIREYVWALLLHLAHADNTLQVKKEEISLPLEANPPFKGNKSYTVFNVTGVPRSFTPSFHVRHKRIPVFLLLNFFAKFQVYHDQFHQIFDRVEAFYDHGQPLHIARPDDSVIKSFTYDAWTALTPVQMQQELSKKNVIVTGWPLKEKLSFNEEGLRKVAGTQSRQISINGEIDVTNSCLDCSLTCLFCRLFHQASWQQLPSNSCERPCERSMGQSPSIRENPECFRPSIIRWQHRAH